MASDSGEGVSRPGEGECARPDWGADRGGSCWCTRVSFTSAWPAQGWLWSVTEACLGCGQPLSLRRGGLETQGTGGLCFWVTGMKVTGSERHRGS